MGSFKRKATAWSPVDTLIAGEAESVPSRRGPSLLFAVAVIGGVTFLTGAAVATFFSQSTQSAAEPAAQIVADAASAPQVAADVQPAPESTTTEDKPVMTASLDPAFPPVRKVVTKSFPALKADQLPMPKRVVASKAAKPDVAAPAAHPEAEAAAPAQPADVPATDAQVASAGDVDALPEQDPRWARNDFDAAHATFVAVIPPAAPSTGKIGGSTDGTQTAAIEPDQVKPKRASAPADDDDAQADEAQAPTMSGATRSVAVNKGVNMRSRGRSGSSVVMTIPKSAVVQVVVCKAWCEVVYKGRRGFIYKSFVGGGSRRTASRSKQQPTVAAAPKDDAKTVYVVDSTEKTDSPETTGSTGATSEKPATPRFTVEHDR